MLAPELATTALVTLDRDYKYTHYHMPISCRVSHLFCLQNGYNCLHWNRVDWWLRFALCNIFFNLKMSSFLSWEDHVRSERDYLFRCYCYIEAQIKWWHLRWKKSQLTMYHGHGHGACDKMNVFICLTNCLKREFLLILRRAIAFFSVDLSSVYLLVILLLAVCLVCIFISNIFKRTILSIQMCVYLFYLLSFFLALTFSYFVKYH